MKQQTSIDWFIDNLPERFKNAIVNTCKEEIEQAKAIHKEEVEMAHEIGYINGGNAKKINGEQYYKETYEK